MSTTGQMFRKNITPERYETDKREIDRMLTEIGFSFQHSEDRCGMTWYSVSSGSFYVDEDGEECVRQFRIVLEKDPGGLYSANGSEKIYSDNLYFEGFRGGYGCDIDGNPAPGSEDLLLQFLHRYLQYDPEALFTIAWDSFLTKADIDRIYDSGNRTEWYRYA